MRILFTGFTSRTIGSERNQYDYMSNVFVLKRALELAGHDVDCRPVNLTTDVEIADHYDCALVGIAACQGLSSRFKLGALWTLQQFGFRAGIFPSDGKNIAVFPSSVLTCLSGDHRDGTQKLDPIDYFLGYLQREKNNVADVEMGRQMKDVWRDILTRLPHRPGQPRCDWPVLVPTHAWGSELVYRRHFGAPVTVWDPTNVAIPMQFPDGTLAPDGRLLYVHEALAHEREKQWVLSSLQDQSAWLKKQQPTWPILEIGNKRKARQGLAVDYLPEDELIQTIYRHNWGHLAFGYPLADGGWWRMRYVHAALAGMVTACDPADARKMPPAYQHTRSLIERRDTSSLVELAREQHKQLLAASWPLHRAVKTVHDFVTQLAEGIEPGAEKEE